MGLFKLDETEIDVDIRSHYYGDNVRKLFIAAAIIMIIALPILRDLIYVPVTLSLIAILVIDIAAGLTNPKMFWVAVLNAVISGGALITFEYFAVEAYKNLGGFQNLLFVANQALAIVFLSALYYGVKTIRGKIIN